MAMINVVVGNNLKRDTNVIVQDTATLRSVLENAGVDYTRGQTHLDGATLTPGDINKTFKDMGVTGKCYLLNVVKADNASV